MELFVVDCFWSTHDLLKEGVTEVAFRRFRLMAPDGETASLLAAQWVGSSGKMPTRTIVHI